MPVQIVQKENKILRKKAEEVPIESISTPKIQKIISDMKIAMHGEDDAVAIAAPQIGASLRIFVVSRKVFAKFDEIKDEKKLSKIEDQVFINPVITKLSKTTKQMEEGCLSARYLYGKVKRSIKATVDAYNEKGEKVHRGASGLLAQIFQHETDHLEGKLFIDKATEVVDLPPEMREEWRKNNREQITYN